MPAAGSPAKCQCCCVDRLCSRGENRGGPPPQGMEQPGRYLPGCFFMPPRKKPPLMLSGGQTVKEPRRVCACGRKESPIIFFGDMCGEENTSQAASVEFVRRWRTNYARSRLQPPCQKVILFDSLKACAGIPAHARPISLLMLPVPAPPRAYRQCSRRSPWRGRRAARASPRR